MQNVNRDRTNVILGQKTKLLFGRDYIKDTLNGLEFEISAQSFYQVNPVQTEKLYQTAIRFANLTGEETAIDAYCGIGTISLSLAEKCRAVYGVEIVEPAIEDAKRNAELNELDNLRFEVGNAEDWMAKWKEKGIRPNVIMVDPPRKGLTESLIESATGMNPDRIVYVRPLGSRRWQYWHNEYIIEETGSLTSSRKRRMWRHASYWLGKISTMMK